MRPRLASLLSLLLLVAGPAIVTPQATQPAVQSQESIDAQLNKLPAALRERGRSLITERDNAQRARLAREMVRLPGTDALEFLLSVLATDPAYAVRFEILDRIGRAANQTVVPVLQQIAVADPDVRLALLALESLRSHQARQLSRLLDQRIEKARASGDDVALRRLAAEDERWISLVRGTMLPAFMRVPPPIFSLKPEDANVRVLAFGDFGTGSDGQKQTALAMQKYHQQNPFDFGVTLGDNFYSVGMQSPSDLRWKTQWESLYGPMGIRVWASFGNHDWGSADSPAAELIYTGLSPSWRMPAPYYTFTAGPIQFFALDTNEMSEAQLIWLKDEIAKSKSLWKIAYGHHPIYSAGAHGDGPSMIVKLLPLLKGRVDVFLAGHEHDLQHLKAVEGLHFFISGGAGAGLRPITPNERSIFAKSSNGFLVVETEGKKLKCRFFDTALTQLHEAILEKSGSVAVLGSPGGK